MKKYSRLVLWSIFSVLMMQTVSAKEVLSAEFAPTTVLLPSDEIVIRKNLERGEKLDKTQDEIYALVKDSPDYKKMHPTLKEWVDNNKDNFKQLAPSHFILYRDDVVGAELNVEFNPKTKESAIYFNRVYFKNPEDAAWQYIQTPAVNPKTKKPWIEVDKKEVQQILRDTKQPFSTEDKAYLMDVLSILNENFHFYYGEEFVSLKGKVKDKSTLTGKYRPLKMLAYGAFDDFLSPESTQKRELSKKLGRALYPVYKLIDNSQMFRGTANCRDKGTVNVRLKDGQRPLIRYWNQVNPKEINVESAARGTQVWPSKYNLERLSTHLTALMQEKGVDVSNPKANKTPLTQALYLINLKTQNYIEAVVTNKYVLESAGKDELGSYTKLSDAVPLPTKLKPLHSLKMDQVASQTVNTSAMCYPPRTR